MRIFFAAVVGVCLLAVSAASADSDRAACLKTAVSDRAAAYKEARNQFKVDQQACDGPCFAVCRATFITCKSAATTTQANCVAAAQQTFHDGPFASCKLEFCPKATDGECLRNLKFQKCTAAGRVIRNRSVRTCNQAASRAARLCEYDRKQCNVPCRATPTPTVAPTTPAP